jgi:FtsP/CotA-like multicopper oxidase with cupredoxin domain
MAGVPMVEFGSRSRAALHEDLLTSEDESEGENDTQDLSFEKERLLKDGDEVSGDAPLLERPRRAFTFARLLVAVLLGLAMGFVAWIYLSSYLMTDRKVRPDQIATNDYLLDPSWDISTAPRRREFTWIINDVVHNPDGVFRPMVVVNHQFPGPLIEANEGDTLVVHVDNQAVNATSIHWHGIYQNGTPHMDGTVGISQCPIAPGGKFTYEFTVHQSGTYWWHAHYGVQSSDGLHGPLIIHSRKERQLQENQYATDRVVLVSDHYHDLSSALAWQYLKPDMENAEPVPYSGIINGRGIVDCAKFPDRKCDKRSALTTIDLAPKQNHRLRLINVGAFAEFQIQIDEHMLSVTEVDGTDVIPTYYHRVNISPAQRYSVIVEANVAEGQSFWFRARMITQCFTDPPENLQSEAKAILRYRIGRTYPNALPNSVDWDETLLDECKDMNSTELVPIEVIPPPARPSAFFYIRSNFEIGAYRLSRGFFNSSSWRPDIRNPTLLRALKGIKQRDSAFSSATRDNEAVAFVNDAAFDTSKELVVQVPGIQTIDILVSNFDDGNHPLHLHGYKYWVLAQGQGYPPLTHVGADINLETLAPLYKALNLTNPLRRDTASVEAFGWILLRFVADNPGAW